MQQRYFITGTDTDVGKTVASAWLANKLKAHYWKPIQSGLCTGQDDTVTVAQLAKLNPDAILPRVYSFGAPLSPHLAAAREGKVIDLNQINLPSPATSLVVEGAGGIFVPLNNDALMIDLMIKLQLPVILVARTALGTINHTLLSLKALRDAKLSLSGVILTGPDNPDNLTAIRQFGNVKIIAHIPQLHPLNHASLTTIPFMSEL